MTGVHLEGDISTQRWTNTRGRHKEAQGECYMKI